MVSIDSFLVLELQVNGVSPNDGLRIAIPKATAGGGGMDVSLSYSTAKPGDAVYPTP